MSQLSPSQEKQLRWFFKQGNKLMMLMWRLGLGRFINTPQGGYIMVLVTTGHKSGLKRYAPVNFARDDHTVYCLPGFGARTHWYRNLIADPNCEVWLPDGWWSGVAEEVTDESQRRAILRRVLVRSGFAAKIFEDIEPAYMSDDHLSELAEHYEKIVQIHLVARRTGPGGPGDLAWVWWILGALLLILWLGRRKSTS